MIATVTLIRPSKDHGHSRLAIGGTNRASIEQIDAAAKGQRSQAPGQLGCP